MAAGGNLPLVGLEAVVLGMAAFNTNIKQVEHHIANLRESTDKLADAASKAADRASAAFQRQTQAQTEALKAQQKSQEANHAAEIARAQATADRVVAVEKAKYDKLVAETAKFYRKQATEQLAAIDTGTPKGQREAAKIQGNVNQSFFDESKSRMQAQAAKTALQTSELLARQLEREAHAFKHTADVAQNTYVKALKDTQREQTNAANAAQKYADGRVHNEQRIAQAAQASAYATLVGHARVIEQANVFLTSHLSLMAGVTGVWRAVQNVTVGALSAMGTALQASVVLLAAWTAAAVASGVAALQAGRTYQQALVVIQSFTGATASEMRALDKAIEKIGTTTTVNMHQAAEAATELGRAGVDVPQQLAGALKAVVDLSIASAGELGLADSAKFAATAMKAFKLEGDNVTTAVNALVAAAQQSAINFVDLRYSFSQVALVAANLGFTVSDTAAAIGILGQAGLRGSDAGTSLRTALQHLQKPSDEALKVLTKLGLSLYDASGAARPFRDILGDLESKLGQQAIATGKLTAAQRDWYLQQIFGTDGARAMLALIRGGVKDFDDLTAAQGRLTASNIAEKFMLPLNAQMTILWNNIQRITTRIGESLIPVFAPLTEAAVKFFQSFKTEDLNLIGQAISALATHSGFGALQTRLNEVLGTEFGLRVGAVLNVVRNAFDTFFNTIVPALGALKDRVIAAFSGLDATVNFIKITNQISQAVHQVGNAFVVAAGIVGDWIAALRTSETLQNNVMGLLKGLALLAGVTVAVAFGAMAVAIGKVIVVSIALNKVSENWDAIRVSIAGLINFVQNNAIPIMIGLAAAFAVVSTVKLIVGLAALVIALERSYLAARVAIPFILSLGAATLTAATGVVTGAALMALAITRTVAVSTIQAGIWIAQHTAMAAASLRTFVPAVIRMATLVAANLALVTEMVVATATIWIANHIRMAIISVVAWAAAMAPVAAVVAGLAIIAAAALALYKAWSENLFGIQEFTGKVFSWVAEKLTGFFTWLSEQLAKIGVEVPNFSSWGSAISAGLSVARMKANIEFALLTENAGKVWSSLQAPADFTLLGSGSGALADVQGILDKIGETEAALRNVGVQAGDTTGAINDFGGSGRGGKAVDKLNELLDDTTRKLRNIQQDTLEKLQVILTKYMQGLADARKEFDKAIQEANEKAQEQTAEAIENLALSRALRARRENLDNQLKTEARMRDRELEDIQAYEQRLTELVDKEFQRRNEALVEHFKERQDVNARAREHEREDEDIAHKRKLEDDERRRKGALASQIGQGVTQIGDARKAELERAGITVGGGKVDEEAEIARKRKLEDEARARDRRRADEDTAYEKQQQLDLKAFELELDTREDVRKKNRDEQRRLDRRAQQDIDLTFEEKQNATRRRLEDTLDDEALTRTIDRINDEKTKRLKAITDTLAEKQQKLTEDAQEELRKLQASLSDQLRALSDQWTDRVPDIIKDGGAQIIPEVNRIFGVFQTELQTTIDMIDIAIEKMKELAGLEVTAPAVESDNVEIETDGDVNVTTEAFNPQAGFGVGIVGSGIVPQGGIGGIGGMQFGGIIPGPLNTPVPIVAHGGEPYLGVQNAWMAPYMEPIAHALASIQKNEVMGGAQNTSSITNNYEFDVNANYSGVQTPIQIRHDLEALLIRARG